MKKKPERRLRQSPRFMFEEGDVIELGYDYLVIMRDGEEAVRFNGDLKEIIRHHHPPTIRAGIVKSILFHPMVFGPPEEEGLGIVPILQPKEEYDGHPKFIIQKT